MPRAAKTARACRLSQMLEQNVETNMDIFKVRRVRGWWPFARKNELGQYELTVLFAHANSKVNMWCSPTGQS
jgi:hypothetical protein